MSIQSEKDRDSTAGQPIGLAPERLAVPTPQELKLARRASQHASLFAPELVKNALVRAFVMLKPNVLWKNPVMFVVEVGTVLTLLYTVAKAIQPNAYAPSIWYLVALDIWLFLTVLFANFAEALAEARGKAQADTLRKTRRETPAYRLLDNGEIEETVSTALQMGDRVVIEAGQMIPGDGETNEGV